MDVVVVGGGPAGVATALTLTGLGVSTAVLEAAGEPRWKPGESLPPSINPILTRLGLGEAAHRAGLPSYGTSSRWGSAESVDRDFLFGAAGDGWRIDRLAFETELALAARRAGVAWHWGTRVQDCVRAAPHGWMLQARTAEGPRTWTASVVVDASGRAARVARLLGVRRVRYDRLVGALSYLPAGVHSACERGEAGESGEATTVVEAVPGGWWYSLGLPNRRLAVAFMTDADLLDEALRRPWQLGGLPLACAPTTAARLRATDCSEPWPTPRIRPAHVGRLASVAGPDWLAVGESAVCFDPISSYGIEAALGTGFYAGAAISEHLGGRPGALSDYAELIDHTFARYLLACHDRYRLERRWPTSPFWRRRHRLGAAG